MIIADACTVILLAKASVLETVAATYRLATPKPVYDEVLAGKENLFPDALLFERLVNEKKITVVFAPEKVSKKLQRDFNMGAGESSVIAVGITENKALVATDNKQGRMAAHVNDLPLVGSIDIVISLYKKNKITAFKAKAAIKILQEEGWFHSYLIEKALEDVA